MQATQEKYHGKYARTRFQEYRLQTLAIPHITEIAATFCSSYVQTWRQGNNRGNKVFSIIFLHKKFGYLI